jgi:peptidoglycan hydrolase CwlO-like protein
MDQRLNEMQKSYDRQLAAMEKDVAAVRGAIGSIDQQAHDTQDGLRAMLEVQSQALDQQKKAVDVTIERLKKSGAPTSPKAGK